MSFSEVLSETDNDSYDRGIMGGPGGGCSLCFIIDGFLTDIFEPSSPKGKIVSFVKKPSPTKKQASDQQSQTSSFFSRDPSSSPSKPISPKSICRAWKMKRREHRQKALDAAAQAAAEAQTETSSTSSSSGGSSGWSERELQCSLKQNANHIQRNFEEEQLGRSSPPTTATNNSLQSNSNGGRRITQNNHRTRNYHNVSGKENMNSRHRSTLHNNTKDAGRSYRYEKYGGRAEFILRNQQLRDTNLHRKQYPPRAVEI